MASTETTDDFPLIISVDDHVVEPRPRVGARGCPAKYRDRGPQGRAPRHRRA